MKLLLSLATMTLVTLQLGCANKGDSRAEAENHYQNIAAQGRPDHSSHDAGQPR